MAVSSIRNKVLTKLRNVIILGVKFYVISFLVSFGHSVLDFYRKVLWVLFGRDYGGEDVVPAGIFHHDKSGGSTESHQWEM